MSERSCVFSRRAIGTALLVFAAGHVTAYGSFWGADPRVAVPLPEARAQAPRRAQSTAEGDYRLAVWAVSRNAYTLARRPLRLFAAEPCHPLERSLALHHPVIAPGLTALPAQLVSGDPLLTFNAALLAKSLLCAFAMFLLVADWTRSAPAGIAAGLLYAYHPVQIGAPYHLFSTDNAWTLLALFFARRLFDARRWRDALGLGLCGALQTAASFYPFLAALALALPLGAWLLWHHGARRVPLARLGLAVAVAGGGALLVFMPYLGLADSALEVRRAQFFESWSAFAPGGRLFTGWLALALGAAGLALPRRRGLAGVDGEPRLALALGTLLVALLATGGNVAARMAVMQGAEPPPVVLPNLYAALASVLPGLDRVRLPSHVAPGAVLVAFLFAGFGAAALLRSVPENRRSYASACLVAIAFVAGLRPAWLGLEPPVRFVPLRLRPAEETLAFFRRLEAAGNDGPLLELPIRWREPGYSFQVASRQQLLSAYHHRRTSGCYGSFVPSEVRRLERLSTALAQGRGVGEARALGFTTLVVHHGPERPGGDAYAAALERAARRSDGALVRIAGSERLTAYGIAP